MAARAPGDPRCKDCAENHEPNKTRCADCLERRRKEASALGKERRAKKLCITCGVKAKKGCHYCQVHLTYYAERVRRARVSA